MTPPLLDRRNFLTLTASALACGMVPRASAGGRKQNILFICIDDLNDWIGVLGTQPAVRTPHIDRLAGLGTLFRHAYCPAPACKPSRESVLRGIHPLRSGVYNNVDQVPAWLIERTSLPKAFRSAGYRTLGGGKVFHGEFFYRGLNTLGQRSAPWNDAYDHDPGWDAFHDFEYECLPEGWPLAGIDQRHFDWGPINSRHPLPDEALANWASGQLSRPAGQPFFMALGFYKPHLPWHVPDRYFDMIDNAAIEMPHNPADARDRLASLHKAIGVRPDIHEMIKDRGLWRRAVRAYLAAIAFVDEKIGEVLDALHNGPHAGNTHIVLWSDNGWHLGEKLHWKKFTLWEEATRVPLIVVPAGGRRGQICDSPVSILDLYRTLGSMAGIDPPADIEGRDLTPLLSDPNRDWPYPAITAWGPGAVSLRQGPFRYTRYRDGSTELYDHRDDPGEWRNRAADPGYAAVAGELAGLLPAEFAAATRGAARWRKLKRTAENYSRWLETAVSFSDPCDD